MKKTWTWLVGALGCLFVGGMVLVTSAAPPEYVPHRFRAELQRWLLVHPTYRWTEDADCNCADDLAQVRSVSEGVWKADPNYHPYLAHGDFDGDGHEEVAVGVTLRTKPDVFRVLILDSGTRSPPFLSQQFSATHALFFGSPRPKPYRLLIGPFDAEGASLQPRRGGGYEVVESDCC